MRIERVLDEFKRGTGEAAEGMFGLSRRGVFHL
jgi:hypothetical protein